MKLIIFNPETQDKLLKGIKTLNTAVASTLGPLGNNVAIDRKWSNPNVTHDGVTVAKEIELNDEFENMGAKMIKEAASKTNDTSGDGTTTATIIAYNMVKLGLEKIKGGVNARRLRTQMKEASNKLIEEIKKKSSKIETPEQIRQIATISAQDEHIGNLIAQALEKTNNGVVSVEQGGATETTLSFKEGMEFNKGFTSPYFVTSESMEAEVESPYILITDYNLSSTDDIREFLEMFARQAKNLVIIATDIQADALATLVLNKVRGNMNILAVKAPEFGDTRKNILEDIAILTGGKFISSEMGQSLSSVLMEDLGICEKVWSDKDSTRIIGGKGSKEELNKRIEQIKSQLKVKVSDYEKEKLEERLAKLTTGVAVINVGAATEIELDEKKETVNDAVGATKSALEQGIVPGGATTLIALSKTLEDNDGSDIVKQAVKEPFKTLMLNSDIETNEEFEFGFGIDVMDGKKKDMIKAGIIDPTKVLISALENATGVATLILTTKTLISEKDETTSK